MKTNFSRFGKSAVSVVLSAVMLLSTFLVSAETVNVNADSVSGEVVSNSAVSEKSVDVSADVLSADNNSVSVNASELIASSSENSDESSKSVSADDVSKKVATVTDKSVSNSKKSEKVTPNSSGDDYSYPEYYTIRFKNSRNWKNVYFYAWNDKGEENADWPGESFWNNTSDDEIYTRYLESSQYGKYNHIIFNNNNGNWADNTHAEESAKTGETKFDKHYHNKIFDAEAGTWEMYNASDYSGSSSSGDLDGRYIIYGTNSKPSDFVNSLPIQKTADGKYYVEFNPVVNQNYFFGLSSSTLYTNLYCQNEYGNNWEINGNNSDQNTDDFLFEPNKEYNITDNNNVTTHYRFSLFKVKNKAIKTVRIYINETYGKNYTIGSKSTDTSGVTVYAKSGTIRESTEFTDKYSELATTHVTYSDGSDLKVDDTNWQYKNDNGETKNRLEIATVARNKEITVTTQLNNSSDYSKYYVKAFCVNGASYNIIDETEAESHKGTGEYSFTYTISDDETGPIEITPIYYYFTTGHENDYITFSVEDFTGDVKALWGDTIACYAYYAGSDDNSDANSTSKPALGGYPGQPMVYINGSYYMQIPKRIANNAEIEGITLNNYIWDDIHSEKVKGISGDLKTKITNKENANCQTYDYDDFIALFKRGASENNKINRIIFNFKYRTYNNTITTTHKSGTADDGYTNKGDWDIGNPTLTTNSKDLGFVTGTNGNGWDALVDYYDHPVDLFARRLVDSESNLDDAENHYITEDYVLKTANDTEKIYVVSNGYEAYYYGSKADAAEKYLGQYATKWYVYKYNGSSYEYLGALPPSAFLTGLAAGKDTPVALNGSYTASNDTIDDNFLNYSDVAENYKNRDDKEFTWSDYQNLYNACAGKPVVISYESNIYSAGEYIDADNRTTQNPGYRVDGRWYYSIPNSATTIWAKAKIQIVDETGKIVPITTTTTDENGNPVITTSDFDTFGENSHTGIRTGANAYFTNSVGTGKDEVLTGTNSMTEVTATQSDTNYFKFTADDYSVGTDENNKECYYIFRGWYVNYGSTSYSPVNNPSELYNIDGQKPMDSNVNVVARYEKVDKDEILTVSHKLLSSFNDEDSGNYDENAPTAHNGTGDPTVTVEIIKNYGKNNATTVYTRTGTDVAVDAVTLARYKDSEDYTIKVTLNTDSTTNTSVVGVYRKDSNGDYLKSGTKDESDKDLLEPTDENAKGGKTDPLNDTENGTGVAGNVTSTTDTETSTKTSQLVYTYPLQNLYDTNTGKLATSSLDYATDLLTDTIHANVVIKYKVGDEYITDDFETQKDSTTGEEVETNKGKDTGVKAYFTTSDTNDTFNNKTSTGDVNIDSTKTFDFEVDKNYFIKTNSDGTTTLYKFEGWFLQTTNENGDVVETTKINLDDTETNISTTGSKARTESATFVAKYAPVTSNESIEISHVLLSSIEDDSKPTVHNGTGDPTVTVEFVKKDESGNVTDTITLYENVDTTNKAVTVDKAILDALLADGYELQITAITDSNVSDTVSGVYRYVEDNNSLVYYPSGEKIEGSNEFNPNLEDTTNFTADTLGSNSFWDWNFDDDRGSELTYTYAYDDLYVKDDDGNFTNDLKITVFNYATDLASRKVNITYKYYDREVADTTQPTDINTIPTETNFVKYIGDGSKNVDKIGSAITDGVAVLDTLVNNVIDGYDFWPTQADAVEGIKGEDNMRALGTNYEALNLGDSYNYHADRYSRLKTQNGYKIESGDTSDGEQWVTYYYDVAGTQPITLTDGDISNDDLYRVKKVVVWGFNYPKTYNVDFYTAITSPVYSDDTITIAGGNATNSLSYYYNQRVGEKDNNNVIDKATNHLEAYDIDGVKGTEVKAPDYSVKNYTFDGWYENVNGNYVKVSSDESYGNRVTKTTKLYAGYREKDTSEKKGITLTQNDVEHYVDTDGTSRVRYVTVLNSYGFNDSDDNFNRVALVYVKLPGDLNNGVTLSKILTQDLKDAIITQLNSSDKVESLTVEISGITEDKVTNEICYTYNIVATHTDGTKDKEITTGTIKFTNKNRAQFVLDLKESTVSGENATSPNLLVFAAVKYENEGANNNTFSNTFTGNEADTAYTYFTSDNYVVYKNGEAVK